jgi:hypothetical protein
LAEDAEFIAFWVAEHSPRWTSLTNIDSLCSKGKQAVDFPLVVTWSKVEVQPILSRLFVIANEEQDSGELMFALAEFDRFLVLSNNHPAKCLRPPVAECNRVVGINRDLFKDQCHNTLLIKVGNDRSSILQSTLASRPANYQR